LYTNTVSNPILSASGIRMLPGTYVMK
jgi:hypothetical protein